MSTHAGPSEAPSGRRLPQLPPLVRDVFSRFPPLVRDVFSRFPPLVRDVFSRLPQFPASAATAVAMNVLLREVVSDPALDLARGKLVKVEIPDAGLTLTYRVHADALAASGDAAAADVTITADSDAMWALVTGSEDADMLFFSRRLVMSGDTELGLLIRNTLDAIDRRRVLRPRLPAPRELAHALREALDVPCGAITRAARRRPSAQRGEG